MKTRQKKQGRSQPTNPPDPSHPGSGGLITLKALAGQLGLHRSNVRKYVLGLGYKPAMCRTPDSGNQRCLAVTKDEAEKIIAQRERDGFLRAGKPVGTRLDGGFFYIVQPEPAIMPARVKLGFATDVPSRLATYRTIVPDAICLKAWPCKSVWERAAMDSLTREGCRHVSSEVYDCEDHAALIRRGDAFFRLMPEDKAVGGDGKEAGDGLRDNGGRDAGGRS